jgi:hypothetical protein
MCVNSCIALALLQLHLHARTLYRHNPRYLDGGQAGTDTYGNVLGATLHGGVFDNAGGNNTQVNNIFLGEVASAVLMDFGAPGTSNTMPSGRPTPASTAGNVVRGNIFVSRSTKTQVGWRRATHSYCT